MTDTAPVSPQDAHDALQSLKEALDSAFGSAPAGPVSDAINARVDTVNAALTAMNQADIASRTVALNAAEDATANPLKQLDALKESIQRIGSDIAKATEVLNGVDKFVGAVSSFFGMK
jgi:hypothetical protein